MRKLRRIIPEKRALAKVEEPGVDIDTRGSSILRKLSPAEIEALADCKVCGSKHVTEKGKRTCIGHVKEKGKSMVACGAPPHTADGRCLQCAGQLTLRGKAAQDWRAGHYAERMPDNLRYVFSRAAETDAMISMKYQMALIDAREVQLLERLGTDESGKTWLKIRALADELKVHIENEDATQQAKTLWSLLNTIDTGSSDEVIWSEIRENAEFRRRLSESERKHVESERAQMSMEQIGQIAAFFGNLLKRYVTDQQRLIAAATELKRYFDGTDAAQPIDMGDVIDAEEIEGGNGSEA